MMRISVATALLVAQPLFAQEAAESPVPGSPALASGKENNEQSGSDEPRITIHQRGGERVEEYRVNNQLFMIKVTPSKGYPYYLMDSDGDGTFETRGNDLQPEVSIPQWVILRWK